jgi:hypothetical protein
VITDAIVHWAVGIATAIVGLFPNGSALSLPDLTGVFVGYSFFDSWFPVHEMFAALGLFLTVYVGLLALQALRAVVKHLPFVGG